MKRLFYMAASMMLVFFAASCQREIMEPVSEGGVTYTITLDDGVQTKGAGGYTEYDLYYQVYKTIDATELETAVLLFEEKVEMLGNSTHVALDLLNSQDYTILFWANKKGADWFDLTDLRNVQVKESLSNNDNRDAFCGIDQMEDFDANQSKTVQLKRPFAQINIATLVPSREELGYDVNPEASLVKVSNVPVAYNVAKGKPVGEEVEVTFGTASSPASKLNVRGTDYKMVAMNYVLVPEGNIDELYYEITTPNGVVKNAINNIPVKPNYRTNIIGNLLTSKADYTVEVLPGFENSPEGDEIVEVWNGSAATKPVWNEEGQYYEIRLASELAWFAQQVNQAGVDTRAAADEMAKDYKLMSDIDLQNQPWVPIGANAADQYRYKIGTFDGQGYTIKNLKVDRNNGAGLFGYLHAGTIKNVNIDGFEINSNHYGGAVLAWGESSAVKVNVIDCHVKNGTVTVSVEQLADGKYDNGDKAGAVVGWNYAGEITGNTAESVTVTAYRDLGGIVGYARKSTVTGNTVSDVILVQNLENNYKNYTEEEAAAFVGNYVGRNEDSTIDNNSGTVTTNAYVSEGLSKSVETDAEGNVTEETYYASKPEGLWAIAEMVNNPVESRAGAETRVWNIILNNDIDLGNEHWTPIGYWEEFTGVFDGAGHTISNLKHHATELDCYIGLLGCTKDATIKNLTIDNVDIKLMGDNSYYGGHVGAVVGYPAGTTVMENITVKGLVKIEAAVDYLGGQRVGAVVGGYKGTSLSMSNILVDATADSYVKGNLYVGGVAGSPLCKTKMTDVTSNIDVYSTTGIVGGIIGYAQQGSEFVNCKSTGNVTRLTKEGTENQWLRIGGIIGCWGNSENSSVRVEDCEYTGKLTSYDSDGKEVQNFLNGGYVGERYDTESESGELIITNNGKTYVSEGVGMIGSTYFVSNLAGLEWFAAQVNGGDTFAGKTVELASDIDLENTPWTPIGFNDAERAPKTPTVYFAGTFDGKGHTISNLNVDKKDRGGFGLFGAVYNAAFKNFTLKNVNIKAVESENNPSDISGSASGDGDYTAGGHLGAVAGYDAKAGTVTFENVHVNGLVRIEGETRAKQGQRVAGIYGGKGSSKVTFKNVSVVGDAGSYIKGYCSTAGVMGQNQAAGTFENVHTDIDITCYSFGAGGIVGIACEGSTFTNCSSKGNISRTQPLAADKNSLYRIGGIAGLWSAAKSAHKLTLSNCSYTGVLTSVTEDGSEFTGFDYAGLVGRSYDFGTGTIGSTVTIDGKNYVDEGSGIYSIDGKTYEVGSIVAFKAFRDQVNKGINYKGKTVNLLSDIDLKNEEWTPIGDSKNNFQGTFDGQNYTVSNLVVNGGSGSDKGLFGMTTNGEIKNLTVNNAKVSGRLNVGVVVGTPYTSKYTNIKVTGHVEVNGMAYVGGVAGKNAYANWKDVTVDVDETSYVKAVSIENGKAYRTYVGGACGFNGEGGHSFTNITSNIDVTGSTCDVGGLFGIAHYGNSFINCTCTGDVEITDAAEAADAEEMGGIAGVWHNGGSPVTFENCKFTGTLTANIIDGVDLTDNVITGKAYSTTGSGELIIK